MSKKEVLKLYPKLKCIQNEEHKNIYSLVTETGRITLEGTYSAKSVWKHTLKLIESGWDPYWRDKMYDKD